MPGPGTPFNSFALPYHIRVDAFTQIHSTKKQPTIHLLTHTHADHLTGLSSKSFSSIVYCSRDAKEMLLKHQVFKNRELYQENVRTEKKRTYSHLKVDPVMRPDGSQWFVGARDLLKALPLNTPTPIELEHGEEITLTLIDANHCPGAVMYLIEGRQGAILHTGDFRAEPWFLDSLARNLYLRPYLAPPSTRNESFINKTLDAIYLDTAGAFETLSVPTKEQATTGLTDLLKCYPADTHFFINAWTWGYEDILKSIAHSFQCQIHVDWYKFSVYQRVSDSLIRSIVTLDEGSTRFHACERFHRCDYVAIDTEPNEYDVLIKSKKGHRVVYVDPVPMAVESWNIYLEDTKKAIRTASEVVNILLVPLARHSPLPELQAFIRLFRPKRVIPNSLGPQLRGLDWVCLDHMFKTCLSPSSSNNKIPPTPHPIDIDISALLIDEESESVIRDIIGSSELVSRWVEKARPQDKLDLMIGHLDGEGRDCRDSEDESDGDTDSEEDNWRTAEALFGDTVVDEKRLYSKAYEFADNDDESRHDRDRNQQKDQERQPPQSTINTTSDTRLPMTPPTSPVRHARTKRLREEDDKPVTLPRKRIVAETDPQVLGSPIHFHQMPSTAIKGHLSYLTIEHRDHVQIDARISELSATDQHREPSLSGPPRQEGSSFVLDPESVSNSQHNPSSTAGRQAHVQSDSRGRALSGMDHHLSQGVLGTSPSFERRDDNGFVRHTKAISVTRRSMPGHSSASEATIHRKRADIEGARQSLELAEKLACVNPGSVVSTYRQARERLLKECARNEVKVQYLEALRELQVVPDPSFVDEGLDKPSAKRGSKKGGGKAKVSEETVE
ncbi:Beta-lactamase-like protein [Amanita muscaria]